MIFGTDDPGMMRIALLGTRGAPARYGGFETAVEEIGSRLVQRGHDVTVYCRQQGPREYLGMRRVELPALRHRVLETISHSMLSAVHAAVRRPDMVFVFNAANSPVLPILRRAGIPTAVHVDGLEWRRSKWSGAGRRYYLINEGLATAWADALIADAGGIAGYYKSRYGYDADLITYGAPEHRELPIERLAELGLRPGGYHLVVARLEPENHVHLIVEGYRASAATLPLVVVGGVTYETDYQRELAASIDADPRIISTGPVYDQDLLDCLYEGAFTYLHGHSVGGTNPSLLRALAAGQCVVAHQNVFNAEVLGGSGYLFRTAEDVADQIEYLEARPQRVAQQHTAARARAAAYTWDDVAARYEKLAERLVVGNAPSQRVPLRQALAIARTTPHMLPELDIIPRQASPAGAEEQVARSA